MVSLNKALLHHNCFEMVQNVSGSQLVSDVYNSINHCLHGFYLTSDQFCEFVAIFNDTFVE